ncbi:MAG TPA: FAD-dependent oxidoreductase, partial [Candidatus Brocadiales bacterium]|nr:FAD-dependent oxidoreductase [Candidatus Brocadiales bacterium]
HRFISKNQESVGKILALMGNELLIARRKSVIKSADREFDYPLSISNIIKNIPIGILIKCLIDYLKASIVRKVSTPSDFSFEQWVVNRFGQRLYDLFFKSYTEKLWGIPPSELSSDWASERISLLSLWDAVWAGLPRPYSSKKDSPRTYTKMFYYPRNGIGQIFAFIAEEIKKSGGSIILNAAVEKVITEDNEAKSIVIARGEAPKQSHVIDCDFVISTIPLIDFVSSLYPSVPESRIVDSVHKLRFRSLRFMNILIDMQDISENTWMYIPDEQYIMTRIQEPRRRSPFNAPEGKTSLMLEIPCNFGDGIWNAPESDIYTRCLDDLASMGIHIKGKVIDYFSTWAKNAYPVYSPDYKTHVNNVLDFIGRYENIITCGRQGIFKYMFMDQAMEMGVTAAEMVARATDYGYESKRRNKTFQNISGR